MKKLLLIFLLASSRMIAQQIDSTVIVPQSPTTNDTVKVYFYLSFPNGTCADRAYGNLSGNVIQATALHCMGMLSVVCYDVDTLVYLPLPAGNYTVRFSLNAGYGPPGNCSPGFVPYDRDTTYFTVSSVTGVIPPAALNGVSVFPVPASNSLTVTNPASESELELFSVSGELVMRREMEGVRTEVDLSSLAPGLYFWKMVSADHLVSTGKLQIVR